MLIPWRSAFGLCCTYPLHLAAKASRGGGKGFATLSEAAECRGYCQRPATIELSCELMFVLAFREYSLLKTVACSMGLGARCAEVSQVGRFSGVVSCAMACTE